MRFRLPIATLAAALVLAPLIVRAGEAADAARYERCLGQISFNPDAALEAALQWIGEGGGAPAKHCHAVALIATGHPDEGATRLEALAKAQGGYGDDLREEMLTQAGNAWLIAENPEAAINDFTSALELANAAKLGVAARASALSDRARAYLLAGKPKEARSDLDASLSLALTAPALVTRARLEREGGNSSAAQGDITRAFGIDPAYPEALLERGRLRALAHDTKKAREDFLQASLLAKNGPIADAAQRELEKLDVKKP